MAYSRERVHISEVGSARITLDKSVYLDASSPLLAGFRGSESGSVLVSAGPHSEIPVDAVSETGSPAIVLDLSADADSAEEVRMSPFDKGTLSRYSALVCRASEVFGDDARASLWLSTPSLDFDGRAPLEIAAADGYSLTRFEPIFARIEHGIDF